jgi:CheY-like chemotaxis protein
VDRRPSWSSTTTPTAARRSPSCSRRKASASSRSALAHLRDNPTPDLIISDVFMPGLNGWELMRELAVRPRFTLVPVMVVTGAPDREGAPADDEWIFAKPVDPEQLVAAVRSALRESSWAATARAA